MKFHDILEKNTILFIKVSCVVQLLMLHYRSWNTLSFIYSILKNNQNCQSINILFHISKWKAIQFVTYNADHYWLTSFTAEFFSYAITSKVENVVDIKASQWWIDSIQGEQIKVWKLYKFVNEKSFLFRSNGSKSIMKVQGGLKDSCKILIFSTFTTNNILILWLSYTN